MPLTTAATIHQPGAPQRWPQAAGDAFYDALIAAHQGLADDESALLNARLVLLLAGHVGDLAVLREAIALARSGVALPDQAAGAATA